MTAALSQLMAIQAQFVGAGALSARLNQRMVIGAAFAGAGSLQVDITSTGAGASTDFQQSNFFMMF
jgi:hypothetical protein